MSFQKEMLERILIVIPNAESQLKNYRKITPDNLAVAIEAVGTSISWQILADWEDMTDTEIFDQTIKFPESTKSDDRFYISTDADFEFPIYKRYFELRGMVCDFLVRENRAFYNGDVIIVSTVHKYFYIFSDNGAYANIELE